MSALQFQFDKTKHEYSESGVVIPSVTQILKSAGWVNYDMVPPDVLERAALRGKLVHQACHFFDADALQPEETLPEEVVVRLRGYKKFRRESGYQPLINEFQQVASVRGMKYGMQYDSTGRTGVVPWIVDIKNGAIVQPSWGIQLAAYDMGTPKPLPYLQHKRFVVQLLDDDYRLIPFADPADYDEWQRCLASTIMKLNKRVPLYFDRGRDAQEAWAA